MKGKNLILVEEIFNSITHGIGAILSIIGLIFLIIIAKGDGAIKLTTFIIFGASMAIMYLMSTLLHSLTFTRARSVFHALDQSSIFLFIASTYTPILILVLNGWERIALLTAVWIMATLGIVFRSIYHDKYKIISVLLYLSLGWAAVFIFKPLLASLVLSDIIILLLGGIAYTLGVVFYLWNRLPFNHVIWHLFVLTGSSLHFWLIYHL